MVLDYPPKSSSTANTEFTPKILTTHQTSLKILCEPWWYSTIGERQASFRHSQYFYYALEHHLNTSSSNFQNALFFHKARPCFILPKLVILVGRLIICSTTDSIQMKPYHNTCSAMRYFFLFIYFHLVALDLKSTSTCPISIQA